MDANKIIDNLVQRIGHLVKENAFLVAQLEETEAQLKANIAEGAVEHAE
jgi:hypothetical protein